MIRPVLLAFALCAASPGLAQETTAVLLDVGKTVRLCQEKLVPCPASTFSCDQQQVARFEAVADDLELKGIAPGTTLCTVRGFEGAFRRTLKVTVKPTPAQ